MEKAKLGFIGIGIMGSQMVLRLLDRGWRVTVWNREPEALQKVAPSGAVAAPSPKGVAEASDIVLTCVLNTDAVRDVVFGPDGMPPADVRGRLLVDFSTIDPAASREMAERLHRERGMAWVDAPVSGGP